MGVGVENAFAALLWQQMQARQLASARKLSKAVSDFYHQQGDSLLANLSAQTIQHWIGARGKADPPPTDAATSAVHRLVSPQNVSDVLRVAATLRLNKAQTTRLLWAADKPSVDELFAVPSSDTGLARVLQTWQIDTPNNLPTPLTSYVGRDEETVTLAELLTDPATRLVTLIGPGGCGKTRLALETARYLLDTATDGVYFVPLEAVQDPQEVAAALLRALGLPRGEATTRQQRLLEHLRGRRILLVLDNMEQLLPAAAQLADLLEQAGRVQMLVTSRTPLGVYGEQERVVAPLPVPERSRSLAKLRDNPAVTLFIARAQAAAPRFTLTRENSEAVRRICTLLGGIPLGIELAAARVREYSPRELLHHFKQSLDLAVAGPKNRPARQQSLRQAIAWSYRLLSPDEQHLFRRLAVFRGGWPREAVGPVCADGAPTDLAIAALLDALVAHSLVIATPHVSGARYSFLEPIREYAREQLVAHERLIITGQCHAEWCIALGESLMYPLQGGEAGAAWLATIEQEYANIQIALDRLSARDPVQALRLVAAIWPYWLIRQEFDEGRQRLTNLLDRVPEPSLWRARALRGLGTLSIWHDLPAAYAHLSSALAFARSTNDNDLIVAVGWVLSFATLSLGRPGEVRAQLATWWPLTNHSGSGLRSTYRMVQGFLAEYEGRFAEAERDLREALADATAADQPLFACMILARLLGLTFGRGDFAQGKVYLDLLETLADRIGAAFYRQLVWYRQGMLHEHAGELHAAERAYRRCLQFAEEAGRTPFEHAISLWALGRLALLGGRVHEARASLEAAIQIARPLQNQRLMGELTLLLSLALWDSEERTEALRRLSAVLAAWETDTKPPWLANWIGVVAVLAIDHGAVAAGIAWLATLAQARKQEWPNRPVFLHHRIDAAQAYALVALGEAEVRRHQATGGARSLDYASSAAQHWLTTVLDQSRSSAAPPQSPQTTTHTSTLD